jgi:hypothetical protein
VIDVLKISEIGCSVAIHKVSKSTFKSLQNNFDIFVLCDIINQLHHVADINLY